MKALFIGLAMSATSLCVQANDLNSLRGTDVQPTFNGYYIYVGGYSDTGAYKSNLEGVDTTAFNPEAVANGLCRAKGYGEASSYEVSEFRKVNQTIWLQAYSNGKFRLESFTVRYGCFLEYCSIMWTPMYLRKLACQPLSADAEAVGEILRNRSK